MLMLTTAKPRTFVRAIFIQMLSEDEWAFDLLYCVAFVVMDKQWLDKNASYMDFNVRSENMNISSYVSTQSANVLLISCLWCHYQEVLKSTRAQLERELMLDDVIRIEDMPSYSLLC
ncbi:ELMO/CED-12 family protein [Zea mays]|uniref:ELMO/CED-12 family protein n=1 Tax=Zea mays TaxID=4577 RepID=A0A1D6PT27_MAIZE|nr:ELMO/CED-12 family protein [Zea mays]